MPKTVALGTVLRVETDTPGVYIAVGNLTEIGVPGPEKPEIDVTDFDSTASEFLAGLPDNGEISFSGFYNAANVGQELLLADAHDPDAPTRGFEVEFTRQDKEFAFQGWVKSFIPSAPGPNEAYGFEGVIRVSGPVTMSDIS